MLFMQLYVTGLALGTDVELELADLIFGVIPGFDFTKNNDYASMTNCVTTFLQVKVYRKHDFTKVHEKINKEGINPICITMMWFDL